MNIADVFDKESLLKLIESMLCFIETHSGYYHFSYTSNDIRSFIKALHTIIKYSENYMQASIGTRLKWFNQENTDEIINSLDKVDADEIKFNQYHLIEILLGFIDILRSIEKISDTTIVEIKHRIEWLWKEIKVFLFIQRNCDYEGF